MNIDDALLTISDSMHYCDTVPDEYCQKHDCQFCQEMYKAQCLKLMEWLNGECYKHTPIDGETFYLHRTECSECMSELESKLKENYGR